ncbi:hypothetical protein D3C71_1663650 [compost metagenome]
MGKQGNADQRDAEVVGKPRPPDDHAAEHQQGDQAHDAPEQNLLAGIVLADAQRFAVIARQHRLDVAKPDGVFTFGQVVPDKTHEQEHQHQEHHHPEERVQDARQLRGAEHPVQPVQRRKEPRQPRHRHQEEADDHEPVAGPVDEARAQNQSVLVHTWVSFGSSSTSLGPTPM